jgi:hypothetical protein
MASAPTGSGLAPGSRYLGTSYPDPMYYQQQAQAFGNSLLLTSQVLQQQQQQQAQQDQAQMRLYLQAAAEDPGAAAGMSDSMAPIAQRNPGFATIIAATKSRGRLADLMTSSVDDFQSRLDGKLKDTTAALATANAMPDTLPPPMITDPATGQTTPAPSVVTAGPGGYPMLGPPQGPQPNPHKAAALQHLQQYMGVGGEPSATPPMLSDVLGEMGGKPAMAAYTGLKHLYGIDLGQEAGVNAWGGQLAGTVKNSWMQELPPAMRGYALARGFKSPQEFQQAASNPSDPAFHMVQAEAGMEPSGSEKARLDAESQRQASSQASEERRHRESLDQAATFHKDLVAHEAAGLGIQGAHLKLAQKEEAAREEQAKGAPLKEAAKQADTEFNQWMRDRAAAMPKGASPRLQAKAEQDFERANPRPFNGADTRRVETAVAKITTSPKATVGGQKPDPDTVRQGVRSLYEQNRARGMSHEAALSKATTNAMQQANR